MFPQDEAGFSIDEQFYVGNSGLLVKPVTRPGVTEETVYIPEDKARTFFKLDLVRLSSPGAV